MPAPQTVMHPAHRCLIQEGAMKAMVYTRYGPPEVVQRKRSTKPTPQDNEVLVRIDAAVVSRGDCTARKGAPVSIRLATGLLRPEEADPRDQSCRGNCSGWQGRHPIQTRRSGVCRDWCRVSGRMPNTAVCRKTGRWRRSQSMRAYAEAAAICEGGLTALPFLRDQGKIQPGHAHPDQWRVRRGRQLCRSAGEGLRSRS